MIRVSNVSDLTARPVVVRIGGESLPPGKSAMFSEDVVTQAHRGMSGTLLVGEIPSVPAQAEASDLPMSETDLLNYLMTCPEVEFWSLAKSLTPAPTSKARALVARTITRAYRNPSRLDPAKFFFTRAWKRTSPGQYELRYGDGMWPTFDG
jgi:ABC-type uncharacterized transport system YnjBCD substrate-binding protein